MNLTIKKGNGEINRITWDDFCKTSLLSPEKLVEIKDNLEAVGVYFGDVGTKSEYILESPKQDLDDNMD